MLTQSAIHQVITAQRDNRPLITGELERDVLKSLPELSSHALFVSGIRRCGKSTLLFQLLRERYPEALYMNFEDPRLYEFEKKDFSKLDQVIEKNESKVLLFDEIQIIPQWERYARLKLDEGFKLVITGSNASLLSKELGTKLTGRHITKELFPFSYREFLRFKSLEPSPDSLLQYLNTGGFPAYVKEQIDDILNQIFEDILFRDVAVRYGIRDVKVLQRLALYLISNVGSPITARRLQSLIDVASANTITDFLSYLEYSYLIHLVPKFSYSLRVQMMNAKKVYGIDTGFVKVNSNSFSDNVGRLLENLVFLHLRREFKEIYYFSEKRECDFVVSEKGKIKNLIQVCADLNADNTTRELEGLWEALAFFKIKKGVIVTLNQEDHFEKDGLHAEVIPCHKFMQ